MRPRDVLAKCLELRSLKEFKMSGLTAIELGQVAAKFGYRATLFQYSENCYGRAWWRLCEEHKRHHPVIVLSPGHACIVFRTIAGFAWMMDPDDLEHDFVSFSKKRLKDYWSPCNIVKLVGFPGIVIAPHSQLTLQRFNNHFETQPL